MDWYLEEIPSGRKIPLMRGPTAVGRTMQCPIRLESSFCSRTHCHLVVDESEFVKIVDFSSNGTFVNGKCYINMDIVVARGDKIGIGCWDFEPDPSNDRLPLFYLQREQKTEQVPVNTNPPEDIIQISDDEDEMLLLDKYTYNSNERQTNIKTEVDVPKEPPQFLPQTVPSPSSGVASSLQLPVSHDNFNGVSSSKSCAQFLVSESKSRQECKNSSMQRRDTNDAQPRIHLAANSSTPPNVSNVPLTSQPNARCTSDQTPCDEDNEDMDMDIDLMLSQSTFYEIKQEVADLECEHSFELKPGETALSIFDPRDHSSIDASNNTNKSASSPIFIIDDDDDNDGEEICSIWAHKLSQSISSQKPLDVAPEPLTITAAHEENAVEELPREMHRFLSLEDITITSPQKEEESKKAIDEQLKPCKKRTTGERSSRFTGQYSDQSRVKHTLDVSGPGPSTSLLGGKGRTYLEEKRRRPEVIDAPTLPTGRGKLRGRSVSNTSTARSDLDKKLQNIISKELIAKQEKVMKDKWCQKPSLEREEEKHRQQNIQQERKAKLKELAEKQTQKRKSEADDQRTIKKPKVKVTQKTRGAFLAEQLENEATKKAVFLKKIPKLQSSKSGDEINRELPSTSHQAKSNDGNDKIANRRGRSSIGDAKEKVSQNEVSKRDYHKHSTRSSLRNQGSEGKCISGENLRTVRRQTSDLKSILKSPGPCKSKTKASVTFLTTPEIRYFQVDEGSILGRKVNCKDAPIDSNIYKNLERIQNRYPERIPIVNYSDEILNDILGWDTNWLVTRKPEVNGSSDVLMPMMQQYNSFEDFARIVLPFFKIELWYSIEQDYRRVLHRSFIVFAVTHFSVEKCGKCLRYVFSCDAKANMRNKNDFCPQQLCIIKVKNISKPIEIFGIITSTKFSALNKSEELLNVQIEVKANTSLKSVLETAPQVEIFPISNIRVELGVYNAVNNLRYSPISKCILNPFELVQNNNFPSNQIRYKGYNELNPDQLSILLEAYRRCIDNKNLNNLFLIEGPPGTGKSTVITNLALQILYGQEVRHLERKKKILICAQSNAAVDIIASKLLEIRSKMVHDKFNLVRFGVYERIEQNVRCVSLQDLAAKSAYRSQTDANRNMLKQERQILETQIEKLNQYAGPDNVSRDELHKKKNRLGMVNQLLGAPILTGQRLESFYSAFVTGAHIVCTTLSSCIKLLNYTKKFDVCIIDEATQCAEPYTLVPLQFGVSSLILVGDTQQLPATVLSTVSEEYGFGTSLFTRIQKCLDGVENSPIQMLKTQYRMHPEICLWSNSYFYKGSLINADNTRSQNSLVKPYAVLSLDYNQDIESEKGKLINVQEAKFVIELISQLVQMMSPEYFTYGVITPYAHHKDYLQKKINETGIKKIMVNTIDSYQGKEKDIIIMSCVRTKGVGFLGNCQRLNVALTRAKKCLFICGNFASLTKEPVWKSLIDNAKRRGLYFHIREEDVDNFQAGVMSRLKISLSNNLH